MSASVEGKISVVGLGYVGLPVILALARKFPNVLGYDVDAQRVNELKAGKDRNGDISQSSLEKTSACFTSEVKDLRETSFFIVAVPTPIDENRKPDLSILLSATRTVGEVLKAGAVVVYESTVYPGVTEDICGPLLAEVSGLKSGRDFHLGYSPERINPGDDEHSLEKVTKIVSGQNEQTLRRVAAVYSEVVEVGLHEAPSIRVAEAAKVIENTQRDLNIALMNELAIIFDRMEICTSDVLAAANTKWNFLPFEPGLVGGHCIGVDPYYLTAKAEELGYQPKVILAGRRVNDSMGQFIAQRVVEMLGETARSVKGSRVGILGLTFKENVSDVRNSRVPMMVKEFQSHGVLCFVHDPIADRQSAKEEHGIELVDRAQLQELDALVFAVRHDEYLEMDIKEILLPLKAGAIFVDVKSAFRSEPLPKNIRYWSL